MKTIRRDKLMALVKAGKVVSVGSYHFDDMTGQEIRKDTIPCRFSTGYGDFVEGQCNLTASDFTSRCGYASTNDDGSVIHLGVHSNSNYDLKLIDGAKLTPVANAKGKRPENVRMQDFLAAHGIDCKVKYLPTGSLKGCWRLSDCGKPWTMELADKLNALGFKDYAGKSLAQFSGNGGIFSVFVRGHDELVAEPQERQAAA